MCQVEIISSELDGLADALHFSSYQAAWVYRCCVYAHIRARVQLVACPKQRSPRGWWHGNPEPGEFMIQYVLVVLCGFSAFFTHFVACSIFGFK